MENSNQKLCPKCHFENSDLAKICVKCGHSKIVDDTGVRYRNLCDTCRELYNATPEKNADFNETTQTDIVNPVSSAMPIQFCRKCGEKFIKNSRFCRKCGTGIVKE